MDKLRDSLREHSYVNYIPLTKLFFRKYAYKVEVHLERYLSKREANCFEFTRFPSRRWAYGADVAAAACEEIAGTYKTRRQGAFCSFYFETENDALTFVETSKPFITEIVAPMSDEERTTLIDDATVRIRKTLFWGKYRWMVRLRWMREDEWDSLIELAEGAYPTPEGQEIPRCTLQGGYPLRAFFNDQNDMLQFRIMASENVFQIEKAVLREEI
jgi:hypothetical protein